MSALPLPRFKTRLLTVVLLGLSIWGLNDVMRATSFRVGEAAVMGASLFTPAQIRSLAAVEGKPVFLVNPQEVHSQLMRQAEVESAQVSVRWPNQVRIQVKERRPVVAWIEDGKTWWLSADGVAFLEHGDWPGLIRVESSGRALEINDDPTSPAIVPDVIDTAIALASLVPQADRLFFDRGQGLGFRDPGGWLVYFGTSGDMAQKFRLYQTLRESLTAIGRPVTQVSVADPTAPYYR